MEVEDVAVGVLNGTLSDAPGFQLEGVGDGGAGGLEVLVGGFDVFGEDPVDGGFEGSFPATEEEGGVAVGDGSDLFAGGEPGDLEVEDVVVVLLGALDVGYREFGDGWGGDELFLLGGHARLLGGGGPGAKDRSLLALECRGWSPDLSYETSAKTGDSRFLAALGMTISERNCLRRATTKARAKAKKKQIPAG